MTHEIELHILKIFMYKKDLTYNQILDKKYPSNKFNYHLQKLIDEEIISKEKQNYKLTPKGTQILSSLDGQTLKQKRNPIVCCFILAVKDNKILINKRLKQPFIDYIGIPGGKLDLGNNLRTQAKEELLDETGLYGELDLKVISNYVTFEKDEIAHHVVAFTYIATNIQGELKKIHREGENFWIKKEELKNYQVYPDIPKLVNLCFKEGIHQISAKRFTEEGKFTGIEFE